MTTAHLCAYPEPPASSAWHRHHAKARPLTAAERRRNRELLELAQHTPRPRSARPDETLTEPT